MCKRHAMARVHLYSGITSAHWLAQGVYAYPLEQTSRFAQALW
jgi:hypothetical protein